MRSALGILICSLAAVSGCSDDAEPEPYRCTDLTGVSQGARRPMPRPPAQRPLMAGDELPLVRVTDVEAPHAEDIRFRGMVLLCAMGATDVPAKIDAWAEHAADPPSWLPVGIAVDGITLKAWHNGSLSVENEVDEEAQLVVSPEEAFVEAQRGARQLQDLGLFDDGDYHLEQEYLAGYEITAGGPFTYSYSFRPHVAGISVFGPSLDISTYPSGTVSEISIQERHVDQAGTAVLTTGEAEADELLADALADAPWEPETVFYSAGGLGTVWGPIRLIWTNEVPEHFFGVPLVQP